MASTTQSAGGGAGDWLSSIANVAGNAFGAYTALEAAKIQAKAGQPIQAAPAPAQAPQFTPTVIQLPPQQPAVVQAPVPTTSGFNLGPQGLLLIAGAVVLVLVLNR